MLTNLYDWKWFLGILKSAVFGRYPIAGNLRDRIECFQIALTDLIFFRMEEFHKKFN